MDTNENPFLNATLEEITLDPAKFGAPTFDEFVRNRERYIGRQDDLAIQVDKGSFMFKKDIDYRYYIEGYRCDSLESVESTANSMGLNWGQMEISPEWREGISGRTEMHVHFHKKREESTDAIAEK